MRKKQFELYFLILLSFTNIIRICAEETNTIPQCTYLFNLEPSEPENLGYFGWSCVLTNKSIIISQPGTYPNSPDKGSVSFYDLEGNLKKILRPPTTVNNSFFGYAMTTCNSHLIIGDPGVSVDGLDSAGAIHFYTSEGEYIKSINSPTPMENGEFGRSLASNDVLLLVGEPGPQIGDDNVTSRVQVYDNQGSYLYTIQQSDARAGCFGMSLSINNETIIISEPYYSHWQGIVYLYDYQGNLKRNITSPFYGVDFQPRNFGFRVSASDSVFSVGEVRGTVDDHQFSGRAYVYDKNGVLLANLTSLKPTGNANFGYVVVWKDMVLVKDYVKVDEFGESVAAVIYNRFGDVCAVVNRLDDKWVSGYPVAFNYDLLVLGNILASKAYVCQVPGELWENPELICNNFVSVILLGSITIIIVSVLFLTHHYLKRKN